jgi:serine protease Do
MKNCLIGGLAAVLFGLATGWSQPEELAGDAGEREGPAGGYLGVRVAPLHPSLWAHLRLPPGTGLSVEAVTAKSPAERAGLEPHDVLVLLDDQLLVNSHQFTTLIRNRLAGDRVELEIRREGQTLRIPVELEERDRPPPRGFPFPGLPENWQSEMMREAEWVRHQMTGGYLGVAVEPVDPTTARQLNLPTGAGLRVRHVVKGSPAERAGFETGDILLELDGARLNDPEHFAALIRERRKGETIAVKLIREGEEREIEAVLGEESRMLRHLRSAPGMELPPGVSPIRERLQELWRQGPHGGRERILELFPGPGEV